MTGILYRIGHGCVRLRWLILAIWIGIAATVVFFAKDLGSVTNNNLTLPGTGSQRAYDLLSDNFPPQQNGTSPIVFHIEHGKLTDPPYKDALTQSFRNINKTPHVYSAYNPTSEKGKYLKLMSADKQTAFIPVLMNVSTSDLTMPIARSVVNGTEPAGRAGIEVAAGGVIGSELSPDTGQDADKIGLMAAAVILSLVFGSLIAMGLPILTALLGLSIALGSISLLGHVLQVPTVAPTLATMIGLGVGIDYALFMLTRHRDHLREGMELRESIARVTATSGGAIVFAGGTVVVAITSLSIAGIPIVSALGYTSAIAVGVAILAAITLLPAVLGVVGHGIFKLQLPKFLRPKDKDPMTGWWAKFAHDVAGHPVRSVLIALAILIPLMIPVFTLVLGIPDTAQDPKSTTIRQAYDMMTNGFGAGYNGPFLVAVEIRPAATASEEFTSKKQRAEGLKRELTHENKHGERVKRRLKRQGHRLKSKGRELKREARPFELEERRLELRANELEARKARLTAAGARLEQRKQHLERQGARLRQKAGRLETKLKRLARREEILIEKIAHTLDPIERHKLERQLEKLVRQSLQVVSQLEQLAAHAKQLEVRGRELLEKGNELERKASRLELAGARLERKGARLEAQSAPLRAREAHLKAQASHLEARSAMEKRIAKREKPRARTRLHTANELNRDLTRQVKEAGGHDRATDPRLVKLDDSLKAQAGVKYVAPPNLNKNGDTAIYSVTPVDGPADAATSALVRELRASTIPNAVRGSGLSVSVGGQTAGYIDLAARISDKLPLIIAVVIALAFFLLMLAFRSIAIPAKAALMNLLSVAAAYGVLTAVFQWGWGTHLVGLGDAGSVPIASYVPLMMFAVLFGLSMDYEVFLMSQVVEHHDEGESDHDAVVSGLAISARVITSAAAIMVAVFSSFILDSDPTVKQFGVGLSVAVLIDATVVRILLVPATMTLLGDVNWWLPKWLARILPDVNIEGTGYFEKRDKASQAPAGAAGAPAS